MSTMNASTSPTGEGENPIPSPPPHPDIEPAAGNGPAVLTGGAVELNISAHTARVNGVPVGLTLQEFRLLHVLLEHVDHVMPSHTLLELIWGSSFTGNPGTLQVHILRLRTKLQRRPGAGQHIRTVRGVGYIFDSTPLECLEPG